MNAQPKSDSPRTDAILSGKGDTFPSRELPELARTLERENATLREALNDLMCAVDPTGDGKKMEPYFVAPLAQARAALAKAAA